MSPMRVTETEITRGLCSAVDLLTAEQRADLNRLTRYHDQALILTVRGSFVYVRVPDDSAPYVAAYRV